MMYFSSYQCSELTHTQQAVLYYFAVKPISHILKCLLNLTCSFYNVSLRVPVLVLLKFMPSPVMRKI